MTLSAYLLSAWIGIRSFQRAWKVLIWLVNKEEEILSLRVKEVRLDWPFPLSSDQRLANFFFRGSESKSRPFEPFSLCCTYSTLMPRVKAATDDLWINEWGCISIKFYLQKQLAGKICPTGGSLLISALTQLCKNYLLGLRQIGNYFLCEDHAFCIFLHPAFSPLTGSTGLCSVVAAQYVCKIKLNPTVSDFPEPQLLVEPTNSSCCNVPFLWTLLAKYVGS